jgi:hypothetical protein
MDETVILCCNTHGKIYSDFVETLPENMNLYRINAVAFGVPNIQTIHMLNRLNQISKKHIRCFIEEPLSPFVSTLAEDLRKESDKEYAILYRNRRIIDESEKFIHYGDQRFCSSDSRQYMNKVYSLFENSSYSKRRYFNKLMLYKTDGSEIDILEVVKTMGHKLDEIKLSELLEFLQGAGYKNIVLVDLTCSSCDIDERSQRIIRRSMNHLRL